MKRFLKENKIPLVIFFAILCIAAGPSLYTNIKLVDLFNWSPQEIWISADRADGHGKGSQADPLDGSSQTKFDAIMTGVSSNTTIHVGKGTFITRGSTVWLAQQHWKVLGAGKDLTVFQLDPTMTPTAGQAITIIGSPYNVDGDGILISDLTLDCNTQNITGPQLNGKNNFKTQGAYLYGNRNGFVRVRVINAFGIWVNTLECSELSAIGHYASGNQGAYDTFAENCIVESPLGDYHCGILLGGNQSGAKTPYGANNVIRHSTANGYRDDAGGHMIGMSANTIVDSLMNGCTIGARWEPTTDIKIINSRILDCSGYGVSFEDAAGANNILLSGTTIEMRNDNVGGVAFAVNLADSGGTNTNFTAVGNTFLKKNVGGGVTQQGFHTGTGAGHGYNFIGNHLDTGMTNQVPADSYRAGNRTLIGGIVPDLLDKSVQAVTFANAPASPFEGMPQPFTDSTTNTWGATITGGGSNHVLGYFDGTNWTVQGK